MDKTFASTSEFWTAVHGLRERLVAEGHGAAADEINRGAAYLNGLTDGWALFEDTLKGIKVRYASKLSLEARRELKEILSVVEALVRRP